MHLETGVQKLHKLMIFYNIWSEKRPPASVGVNSFLNFKCLDDGFFIRILDKNHFYENWVSNWETNCRNFPFVILFVLGGTRKNPSKKSQIQNYETYLRCSTIF